MEEYYYLPQNLHPGTRAMMFIDGENLAIRYKNILGSNAPRPDVEHEADIFVWNVKANVLDHNACEIIRHFYYTSVSGDSEKIDLIKDRLINLGIEAPRVFKKKYKNEKAKSVDIMLATEMLSHAYRKNYDIAVLVSGDGDYVPVVEAVKAEGCRVILWFFEEGLSPLLRRAVDYSFNLSKWFIPKRKP